MNFCEADSHIVIVDNKTFLVGNVVYASLVSNPGASTIILIISLSSMILFNSNWTISAITVYNYDFACFICSDQ